MDILFNTPQGKRVLSTLFNVWNSTNDFFQAYDAAKEEADKTFITLPLQIVGALDLLKLIAILKPEILIAFQNMLADILFPPKTKKR